MRQIDDATDLNGRPLQRGDTVTTVGGGTTGKIKDIVSDDGALFIEVRPLHRASGKGVWHAADRVLWLSSSGVKSTKPGSDPRKAGKSPDPKRAKSPKMKK
ncbi:MAG: hypothetical protein R3C45_12810 [Phycisphaerales bacterium]